MQTHDPTPMLSILLLSLITVIGCKDSSRPKDLPTLYRTKITILQDGKGLEGAAVNLIPEIQSKWSVGGLTDANGICSLRTHGQFDGAPEGKYQVLVKKVVTELPEVTPNTPKTIDGHPILLGTDYALVAPEFSDAKRSTFSIEVSNKEKNEETFDVGSAVKIKK